jgi:hypothetical protein
MTTLKRAFTLTALASLAALAVACAGGATTSVSSPSASSFPGSSSGSGATISGTVATPVTAHSFNTLATNAGLTVSITGTGMSSTVDASGRFTLSGVPSGDIDLHISGAGTDAHVRVSGVGDHEHITITLTVTGSAARVEDSERDEDNNEAEVEGLVTAVNLTARTLTVRGKTVTVPAGTSIRHGDTVIEFAQIKVGDRVHVHGTNTASGITATRVTVQNDASNSVDHD